MAPYSLSYRINQLSLKSKCPFLIEHAFLFKYQVRDKKRDRARDEDLEEDTRPKQNSTDLPFMTVEEASMLFVCGGQHNSTLPPGLFSFTSLEGEENSGVGWGQWNFALCLFQ